MSSMLKLAVAAVVLVAAIAAGSMLLDRGGGLRVGGPQPSPSAPTPSAYASPTDSPAAPATLFGGRGRLEAGRYTTDLVRPGVTMELPCCFQVIVHDSGFLVLQEVGLNRHIVLTNPDDVYDPATGSPVERPADLAAWLAEHPGLDVNPPVDVEVGGLPARRIDGRPRPDANYNASGELELTRRRAVDSLFVASDHRFIIDVVDATEGPVVVAIIARDDVFDEFLPTAEAVVASLALGTGAP